MKQLHEEIKKNQEHGSPRTQVKKVFQEKDNESTVSNTVKISSKTCLKVKIRSKSVFFLFKMTEIKAFQC